jgi:hypothetical protein
MDNYTLPYQTNVTVVNASCTLSYSCKLLNITARNATSCYDFTLPKRITVIFKTHDVSTFIFSVKKKNYADNHFQLTSPSKTLKWLPLRGVGCNWDRRSGDIDIFIDRRLLHRPPETRDCIGLDRREPITMQRIESHMCEPITDLSSSGLERWIKYFYGMHPVVYLLINGISRSVYTTTFNNNKTK